MVKLNNLLTGSPTSEIKSASITIAPDNFSNIPSTMSINFDRPFASNTAPDTISLTSSYAETNLISSTASGFTFTSNAQLKKSLINGNINVHNTGGTLEDRVLRDSRITIDLDGNPIAVYVNTTDTFLYFIRALNKDGSIWGSPILVSNTLAGYFSPGILIVKGNPAIFFIGSPSNTTYYVRANDPFGASWGALITLTANSFGLAVNVINTKPAFVAVSNSFSGNLIYRIANDAGGIGTSFSSEISLITGPLLARSESLSLIEVNGSPAVGIKDFAASDQYRYLRATTSDGALLADWTGGINTLLTQLSTTSKYNRLVIVNGFPTVFYNDNNTQSIKVLRADNSTGSAWTGTSVVVNAPGSNSLFISAAFVGGFWGLTYVDTATSKFRYIKATNIDATTFTSPVVLFSSVNTTSNTYLENKLIQLSSLEAGFLFTTSTIVNTNAFYNFCKISEIPFQINYIAIKN